jgi:glutamate-1-semialdehyde 2,1-aminomutase
MTAGLATLRALLRPGVFESLAEATATLAASLERACREEGVEATAPRVGGMLGLWFAPRAPRNLSEARATRTALFAGYHRSMLAAGVHLPPSPFEAWFLSTAHAPEDLRLVASATRAWARGARGP